MIPIYYPDHDQRYAHLTPPERLEWPDAIRMGPYNPIFVRRELTEEDYAKHNPTIRRIINAKIPWSQI